MLRPGWGAILRGAEADLEDWRYNLRSSFNPSVELHDGETVLRSTDFDELKSSSEVRLRALATIEYLNGAVSLAEGSRPISFGGVINVTVDGKKHRTVFLGPITFEVGGKLRATLTVSADGKNVPQMSDVQKWAAIAERDEALHLALIYFGREKSWFDIYKTMECLELRFANGAESEFLKLGWAPIAQVKLMKRTANLLRHAKGKFDPPEKPMSIDDAEKLLGELLRRGLHEAETRS